MDERFADRTLSLAPNSIPGLVTQTYSLMREGMEGGGGGAQEDCVRSAFVVYLGP